LGAFLENCVLLGVKTLSEWERRARQRGAFLQAGLGAAFGVDVDSHEQLSDMLHFIPIWSVSDIDIVPVESNDHRYKADRRWRSI
jgi:muconolactone delta-isomerase